MLHTSTLFDNFKMSEVIINQFHFLFKYHYERMGFNILDVFYPLHLLYLLVVNLSHYWSLEASLSKFFYYNCKSPW